jgi:2-amino-4-hydroxy-6-hydroxymethyldihydropteridine diphosphokinase
VTRTRAYLALGSNLGDRVAYLQHAIDALAASDGVDVVAVSRVYATKPVGGPAQDEYLNAVAAIDTVLTPHELLDVAHAIESSAQRVRTVHWGPRTLDVDVLLYGDVQLDDELLTIPHPRMWERDFVLVPLHDVAPDVVADAPHTQGGVRDAEVALRLPVT